MNPDLYPSQTLDRAPQDPAIAAAIASRPYRIAVVGFGPKGLYAFERLLAELCHQGAPSMPVEIHLFNRCPYPAAGDVYRPDQPHYLLMNFSNAHIDAGPHSAPSSIVGEFPDLVTWLAQNGLPADPHGYTPRAVVGQYLTDVWTRLRDACPDFIDVHLHHAEVFDLAQGRDKYERLNLHYRMFDGEAREHTYDRVILTTGHQRPARNDADATIDFIYPVSQLDEQTIAAGSRVAIRGLGLTFIDAALALTEGRGGNFQRTAGNGFVYQPSGREPACLLPFSRSGLPMVPRGRTHDVNRSASVFFTAQTLAKLRKRRGSRGIDFDRDLLPLLLDEVTLAYYRVAARVEGDSESNSATPPEHRESLPQWIDAFHRRYPHQPRFQPGELFDPFASQVGSRLDPHQQLFDYWTVLDNAAGIGETDHPLIAAATTWRHLSATFADCYRDGGLDAASHRSFLQCYAGHFNRLAFGPPLINSRKILALCRAGLIDFSFSRDPDITAAPDGEFQLNCRTANESIRCDALIDARIPRHRASADPAPLYRRMIERGLARLYVNRNTGSPANGDAFCPGCIEITATGELVARDGEVEPRITVYGTPTEGLTWDNDTLSRRHNDFASRWARTAARAVAAHHPATA